MDIVCRKHDLGDVMNGMRKWAAAALLTCSLLTAGCGSEPTALQEYSFGYTQMKAGQSEIYVMTPFQLGEMKRNDGKGYIYIGEDSHLLAISEANPAEDGLTPESLAERASTLLKQTDISDLQTKMTKTMINGTSAVVIDNTYVESDKGRQMRQVSKSLFFEDNGQVWHIRFLYHNGDALGTEAIDYVFGHIK